MFIIAFQLLQLKVFLFIMSLNEFFNYSISNSTSFYCKRCNLLPCSYPSLYRGEISLLHVCVPDYIYVLSYVAFAQMHCQYKTIDDSETHTGVMVRLGFIYTLPPPFHAAPFLILTNYILSRIYQKKKKKKTGSCMCHYSILTLSHL